MITLKTLNKVTAQEVFDQVSNHLLTQMQQSADGCMCLYRSPNGLKCAAGCLISDDEYNPNMEGNGWAVMVDKFDLTAAHEYLIERLQAVHDLHAPGQWAKTLKNVAREFSLEFSNN